MSEWFQPEDPQATPWSQRPGVMLAVVIIGGGGFVYKFMEFARTLIEGELLGFAVVPLLIYVLIATGFACLLLWSVFGGQFRHVEEQKHRLMRFELEGDDPVPLPHPGYEALSPPARACAGLLLVGSVATMAFLFWNMFQLPTDPAHRQVARAPMEVIR